jgi:hypothetical protein
VWIDPGLPVVGKVFFYMNRAIAPHVGSWGASSFGVERTVDCP